MTTLVELERQHILEALRECRGVMRGPRGAATKLGMKIDAFLYKIKKHNITRQEIAEVIMPDVQDPIRELQMERAVTKRSGLSGKRLSASRVYGTIDYIAKYIFRGDEKMVSYARLVAEDGDSRFQTFVEAWEADRSSGLPSRAHETLATIAKNSGINSIDFCVEVMRACMKRNIDISNMYAGLAHPKVVQRNIAQALKPKGIRDREIFFQHTGWLPLPKGSQINVNAQATAQSLSAAKGSSNEEEGPPLPPFEEQTVEASMIARREFEEQK